MSLIYRKVIFKLFIQAFNRKGLEIVSGINPCIVKYNGTRYNVYIKNLTPAQLSNKNADIWRCQLPKLSIFNDFKVSQDMFLLLGYDASNDVYATWNPYWAKQRLNVGENVSMYSRYTAQTEAKNKRRIIQYKLNNNGIVMVFPRFLLPIYLNNISDYFTEETEYKTKNSNLYKKPPTKIDKSVETFEWFNNPVHIENFKVYVESLSIKDHTKQRYITSIKYLFKNDLFEKHRDIFLRYHKFEEYAQAIQDFYKTEDIAYMDRYNGGQHGHFRTALRLFYKSLVEKNITVHKKLQESDEKHFDDDKKHPNICTPELVKKLAPLMCQTEPKEMEAMEILYDTFGDLYNETMELTDWLNLLRKTDWLSLAN